MSVHPQLLTMSGKDVRTLPNGGKSQAVSACTCDRGKEAMLAQMIGISIVYTKVSAVLGQSEERYSILTKIP